MGKDILGKFGQAEIHWMAHSKSEDVRREALDELLHNFAIIYDKEQAWNDLHSLTQDKDVVVRRNVAVSLGGVFQHIPEKYREQTWNDLLSLTKDKDPEDKYHDVRWGAAYSLALAFPYMPEKYREQAWNDLHNLTKDKDYDVREGLATSFGEAFQHIPEKYRERAMDDLHNLATENNVEVRWKAEYSQKKIVEIQEKAEEAYQESRGTPTEKIASAIKQEVKKWEISDQEQMTRNVEDLTLLLKSMISFIPKNEHIYAKIEEIRKEKDVTKQYGIISTLIPLIPRISFEEIYIKLDQIDVKTDKIIEYIKKIDISCNQIIYNLENGGVRLKEEEKEELKNLFDDLNTANEENLENFKNKLDELKKWLEDSKRQEQIEKVPEKDKPKIKKIFSRIIGELGIALTSAITAEALLPRIEAIMSEITILSGINPALASTLILLLITIKKSLK